MPISSPDLILSGVVHDQYPGKSGAGWEVFLGRLNKLTKSGERIDGPECRPPEFTFLYQNMRRVRVWDRSCGDHLPDVALTAH
jgi:hypothetical protein